MAWSLNPGIQRRWRTSALVVHIGQGSNIASDPKAPTPDELLLKNLMKSTDLIGYPEIGAVRDADWLLAA
jgi:hypothetical protein